MKRHIIYIINIGIICITIIAACKKQDSFLNVKQNINQVKPQTLNDFQAIMDNVDRMNLGYPCIGNIGTDNLYISDASLASISTISRNAYLWQKDIFQGAASGDWAAGYSIAEYANIALDGLNQMTTPTDQASQLEYNNIKGSALFFRTMAFYTLAEVYCKPYSAQTASTDLGLILRLTSDVSVKSTRSTVTQTYQQMISDLKIAINLLPVTPLYQMRPSRPAANALLAKIYLEIGDYTNAATYANNSLNEFNTLLDFNSSLISPKSSFPFPAYPNNPEIILFAEVGGDVSTVIRPGNSTSNVDTTLIKSYDANDLRKTYFYKVRTNGTYQFRGAYDSGDPYEFCGIAANEVYLIRAESYARTGNLPGALADLNTLLIKRYKTGTYTPINITDQTTLLTKILLERRKELPFTGQLRWEDLRRLNQDPNYAITLTRVSNGNTYTLAPNAPRYVLPIPDNEIQLSGVQQNQR